LLKAEVFSTPSGEERQTPRHEYQTCSPPQEDYADDTPENGETLDEHYLQLPSISHQHHQIVKEGAPDQYVDTTENRAVGRALFSSLLSG